MWGEERAYTILLLEKADTHRIKAAWIGGVALAAGISTCFVIFVNLFIHNPQPALAGQQQ